MTTRRAKVVPISAAAERRRAKTVRKGIQELHAAAEGLADDVDAAAHFVMVGNMAFLMHAFEEAITAFSRALSLAPDDVNARAGRARAYASLGKHKQALADFERAAALAPDDAQHHMGRANALGLLGHLADAVAATTRAIEIAPSAGAHYTRAIYRSHVNPEDPGIRADLDRAAELSPPDEVFYLCERAHYVMDDLGNEDWQLAVSDMDRAIAITPDDARLHYLRAQYLTTHLAAFRWYPGALQEIQNEVRPRCEAAFASLERAGALAPDDKELQKDICWAIVGLREVMPDRAAYLEAIDDALHIMTDCELPILVLRANVRWHSGDLEGAEADKMRLRELGWFSAPR